MKSHSHALSSLSIFLIVCLLSALGGSIMAQAKYSLNVARLIPQYPQNYYSDKPNWGGGLAVVLPLMRTDIFPAVDIGMEYFNCYSQTESITYSYYGGGDFPYYGTIDLPTSQGVYRFYMGGRLAANLNEAFRLFVGGNYALAITRIHTAYVTHRIFTGEGPEIPAEMENVYSKTKSASGYDLNAGCELELAETFIFESGMRYIRLFQAPIQLNDIRAIPIAENYFQIYFSVGALFHKTQIQ